MKYLLMLLIPFNVYANDCSETRNVVTEDVVYNVDTKMPQALKGAEITVKAADGKTYTFKAEEFMVVPRKQQNVLGQNKTILSKVQCSADTDKNIVSIEARKDIKNNHVRESTKGSTKTLDLVTTKDVIPGVNYFRREVIGDVGVGAGVDTNKVIKATIGIEF